MFNKKRIALPLAVIAFSNPAHAGIIPNIAPFLSGANLPQAIDYTFDNRGLTVTLQPTATGYSLVATGTGSFTFYGPNPGTAYSGTSTSYSLTANFSNSGTFLASGSELKITGALSTLPTGATSFPSNNVLFDANLTGFGYNPSQATIGFTTQLAPSWADQTALTGGSLYESVYLFDRLGIASNGQFGALSQIVSAFANNELSSVAGKQYLSVESLATVPAPLSAVLFGSGLSVMLGARRLRRNDANSQ